MTGPDMPMRLRDVPPRQGTQWVKLSFATFLKQPFPLAGLFGAFLLLGWLFRYMPMLLQLAMLAFMPIGSLVFMVATRNVVEQRGTLAQAVAEPWRTGRRQRIAQAVLGLTYMFGCVLIVLAGAWVDGGALADLMETLRTGTADPQAVADKASDPRVVLGLATQLFLAGLLSVPFWHAPALVHWGGQGAGQALFSSTLACWRNKGAFTLYGLTWAWVLMLLSLVSSVLFAAFGQGQSLAVPLVPSLVAGSVFYVSLYFTFVDCFERAAPDAPIPPQRLETP